MTRKQLALVICTLILIMTDVLAQGTSMVPPSEWKKYGVEGEEFSVILPNY